jgi:hypothetical protein
VTLQHILCPVDGSEPSAHAIPQAIVEDDVLVKREGYFVEHHGCGAAPSSVISALVDAVMSRTDASSLHTHSGRNVSRAAVSWKSASCPPPRLRNGKDRGDRSGEQTVADRALPRPQWSRRALQREDDQSGTGICRAR